MQLRDDHAADESREGIELVQPSAPELRDLGLGDRDATEKGECDDDEWVQQGGYERGRRDSSDHLAQCYREQFRDENHEKLIPRSGRCVLEARHIVKWQEKADSTEDRVWELGDDEGRCEGKLAVHFRRGFAIVDHPG